jgi:hypothetical protein
MSEFHTLAADTQNISFDPYLLLLLLGMIILAFALRYVLGSDELCPKRHIRRRNSEPQLTVVDRRRA